jgi:hypothetical protein
MRLPWDLTVSIVGDGTVGLALVHCLKTCVLLLKRYEGDQALTRVKIYKLGS